MLSRSSHQLIALCAAVAAGFATSGCERAPLLAPTGSSITLTTATTALPANGTATIIAQVMESAGTPPHSGTRVTFTTTLGSIDPVDASTDASGRAVVTFRAGGASGIAIIAATSGGASTSTTPGTGSGTGTNTSSGSTNDRNLRIAVGAAAVGRVIVAATPSILPTIGGNATITANVLDVNGNPLSAAPVTFTSTAGSLSAPSVNTDASGNAVVTLTTFQTATVTATVGLGSTGTGATSGNGESGGTPSTNNRASVTVSLTSAPALVITPPTTPPSAGLPSSFTFRVTPATTTGGTGTGGGDSEGGTNTGGTIQIRDLVVDWGDGSSRDSFGAVSGEQPATHTYRNAGTFLITATVTDIAGGTSRVSTTVTVIPVPRPSIIVTPTPQNAVVGSQVIFRIEITAQSGLTIQNVSINFGDGTSRNLGGASGVLSVPKVYTAANTYSVDVSVTDATGQTTVGTTVVSVTPP